MHKEIAVHIPSDAKFDRETVLGSLKEFAVNATKEEGEFYTPHDVVQLIATMIA